MHKTTAAITGVATYLPEYVLSNAELEKMVDTTDEWIRTRTGISERRILKEEGRGVSFIAEEAIKKLLTKTNTDPNDIELIIFATVTPDHIFPATANKIAYNLGMNRAWGFDLEAACSGFLYSLTIASKLIEAGMHRKVLVVGADKMSSIIDYTDRATCIIFGDGGGAVLLEANQEGNGLIDSTLHSDGVGVQYLHMKAGGSVKPPSIESVMAREHYVFQEGKTVFKFAVTNMADACEQIMKRNNLTSNDIQFLLAHQANQRIIDATAQRMGLASDKVLMNIHRYGNTTNGTIPLLMSDFENRFHKGDNLILAAFGGGFTWGATYLKWAY
ncbi:MAG: ketoacyl-ACP synthase III [Bacteroidetes bacterium]|jgi:3-oxoacyl-[acyl-carrier-protein] synthase-3|nr:ketoacyl-ACP synthase III [Bacteroidota bacterium]